MEIEILKQTLREAADTIQQLRNEIAYLKDARTPLVAAAAQELQVRLDKQMPYRQPADGRVQILSKRLRQECAYILYLEEVAGPNLIPFNDLPKDKRESYFKRVDAQVEGGQDPGRFMDPHGR